MAFRLLRHVRHKPIGTHVTVKELQPGQVEDLYDTVSNCLGEQFDQALGSLDEEKRADALRAFAAKIATRYVGSNPRLPAQIQHCSRNRPHGAIDADSNVETLM